VSATYFIAKVTQLDQYVVTALDGKVVAGPFPSAKEAIAARSQLEREAAASS